MFTSNVLGVRFLRRRPEGSNRDLRRIIFRYKCVDVIGGAY